MVEPTLSRLDVQSVPTFKTEISKLIEPGGRMVIDMHEIQFVDSTGLGALLSLLRKIKETEGELHLARVSDQTLAMFRLVKMTRIFDLHATVEEAAEQVNV